VSVLAERGVLVPTRIVGGGRLEHDLGAQIEACALGGTVELVGARSQTDVLDLIRRAAVLVAPCVTALDGDRDGLPTVLLEAMATGTPVIATPVTGIPEVVIDGETGLVVPESDPYALANAIERLLGDPTLGARLARAARALVEEQFDVRRQAAALGALRLGRRCEAVSA
jgi:glycosyltransferase involved in cell wall biosynthesis